VFLKVGDFDGQGAIEGRKNTKGAKILNHWSITVLTSISYY